jgi:outer membrane protein TolC
MGRVSSAQDADISQAKELVLNLDDCIKMALENNEKVIGAGYGITAAEGQLKEAKATGWPVIEYQWRVAPVPTDASNAFRAFFDGQLALFNSFRFTIGFPLFASGQIWTAKDMAKNGVAASKQNDVKEREGTIFMIKQLYNGVLLANEVEKLLSDAVEKINNKVKDEEAQEVPTHSPYDLLKLKVFGVELEKRLAETMQNRELALQGLRIQMGLQPEVKFRLSENLLKPITAELSSLEKYMQASIEHRPEMHMLDIGVDTRRLQYKLEKQKLGPSAGFAFFLEGGITSSEIFNVGSSNDYNNPFNYARAGVGLQVSGKLDIHGASGRIKKAKAEYFKAVYDRLIAEKGLKLDLEKAYLTAERKRDDVRRMKRAESLARQMMFLSKSNSELGIGDEKDYTDALQLVLLSRGQYFQSVFDYNTALADLEQKVGQVAYELLTPKSSKDEYEMFGEDDPEDIALQ